MQEWCMAHPWMTFFIITGLLSGPVIRISHIHKYRNKKD